jgi:hypothetical protein
MSSGLIWRKVGRSSAWAAGLTCSGMAVAATTVVAPVDWGALQLVAGANDPGNLLVYPFTVRPDQPLSISVTFVPSAYTPGPFDPGFISPGWFYVTRACSPCGMEGNVIFDMAKHYPPGVPAQRHDGPDR